MGDTRISFFFIILFFLFAWSSPTFDKSPLDFNLFLLFILTLQRVYRGLFGEGIWAHWDFVLFVHFVNFDFTNGTQGVIGRYEDIWISFFLFFLSDPRGVLGLGMPGMCVSDLRTLTLRENSRETLMSRFGGVILFFAVEGLLGGMAFITVSLTRQLDCSLVYTINYIYKKVNIMGAEYERICFSASDE